MKDSPRALSRSTTVEDGFRFIFGDCLQHMERNASGVVQSSDPECVHQMRVGMRRLRTALRLFAPWVALPDAMRQELSWLNSELGAARDADVLADSSLMKIVEACPTQTELVLLRKLASTIAMQKRQKVAQAIASERYARLTHALREWCAGLEWRAALDKKSMKAIAQPLGRYAPRILMRHHQKLTKLAKNLPQASPKGLHEVRIAAKRARYATEFFQPLLAAKEANRYVKRITALQDALGCLNDAATADRWLREIESTQPDMAHSASFARGYLCAEAQQDRAELARRWERFRDIALPSIA